MKATEAQKRIFEFVESGAGNGIIDAVAGAGKTTTLMGCVMHIHDLKDVIYCAFNTSIRKELQKKFKDAKINVEVSTIHALGFLMLRATRNYILDDYKYNHIIKEPKFFETLVPDIDKILDYHSHPSIAELRRLEDRRDSLDWADKNALNEGQQYVGKIIMRLLDINQKYRCTLELDSVECYDSMIRHFGIIPHWEQGYTTYPDEVAAYFNLHQKLLKEGNSMAISHGIIDFTDQLYLPYYMHLTPKKKYGFVFVDECQDLSKAQVKVVEKYLREDGRLLAVGDPYQAIYGFAGADCQSFERVKQSFNCTVLGLTDCFRCPQDVITLAQSLRADIKGFKDYPGKLYKIPSREVIVNIKEGDLVICRSRRPLRDLALKLINKDFKVKIHPDELQEFMGDYKRNFTPQELRKVLNDEIIDAFFDHAKERNRKRITKENQNADAIIRKILIKEDNGHIMQLRNTKMNSKDISNMLQENDSNQLVSNVSLKAFTQELGLEYKEEGFKSYHNNKNKEEDEIKHPKIPFKPSFKASNPVIPKWRSAENTCIEIEHFLGNKAHDVSTQNLGYDIESTTPSGKIRYIEVKSISKYDRSFCLTNNEYTAAHQYGDAYFLCILYQGDEKSKAVYIQNPLSKLKLKKRIRQWEWFCDEYQGDEIEIGY